MLPDDAGGRCCPVMLPYDTAWRAAFSLLPRCCSVCGDALVVLTGGIASLCSLVVLPAAAALRCYLMGCAGGAIWCCCCLGVAW